MNSRLNMACEVKVCNLCHHGAISYYDANLLAEIEQEIHILKLKLQHWTSRQEHVIIQLSYVWHAGMKVKDFYMHYDYVYVFHSIDVMVTCMIDVS